MRANENAIQELREAFDQACGEDWLLLLKPLAIAGIADSIQIRTASGIERTRQHRIVDKFTQFNSGLPPVLHLLDHTIPRTGQRGRLPNIYLLTDTGAALLRAAGLPDAHACGLQDDHAMAHKLCMVDIHLSAAKQNLEVLTDRVVPFRDTETLRPDHQIRLSDGTTGIIEVEQVATQGIVPRISNSLNQKYKFFSAPESAGYRKEIRMVLNVPPGHKFIKTCNVWRSVIENLREELGEPLNFTLKAIPLVDFLLEPEWEVETSARWWDLTAVVREPQERDAAQESDREGRITRNSKEDLVLLTALHLALKQEQEPQWAKTIDLEFLDVMLKIYEASHPEDNQSPLRWMPPHGSLSLLKDYFDLHPTLRRRLHASLHHNTSKWSWNSRTILHRMQRVINTFLAYYGWKSNAYLSAKAVLAEGAAEPFQVSVGTIGFFWGGPDESRRKTDALQWVLTALFQHAEELGLGRPRFW
jgi:hypothetical protein